MPPPRLRHSVRALILDAGDRILLGRHVISEPEPIVVWAAPGGGVEHGETPLAALRRELLEEIGLTLAEDPPHVWHQRIVGPGYARDHDGVVNDYFLVRTGWFEPRGTMSDEQLAAEDLHGQRWWSLEETAGYRGADLFSPRDLSARLAPLLDEGVPPEPEPMRL
jgi:ADP-ribose pyrophosphatase YjhB (NUDIX family)